MYTLPLHAPSFPSCLGRLLVQDADFYVRFSTCSVYGVRLGYIYTSADCTVGASMLGPGVGVGAVAIFLYKLSEDVTN